MIFQLPIDLEIPEKTVQAIIDLDTGLIGFTELVDSHTMEYHFLESPIEFRKAFLEKMERSVAEKSLGNLKICRKDEKVKRVNKIFLEK